MKKRHRKRLLLINPWIYDFSAFDLWSKPVGLLYIAAYLRRVGYRVELIDCLDRYHPALLKHQRRSTPKMKAYGTGSFHREIVAKPPLLDFVPRYFARYGLPEDIFFSELKKHDLPAAVLVTSLMTYWYPGPRRVIEIVQQVFPGVPVLLGGIYATLLPDHARKQLKPDYLITGPAEIEAARLLSQILPEAPVDSTPPKTLDDFPPPAFDLYPRLDYLVVMSSRGCPFHCTFCATDKISGAFTQRKPDRVVEEILRQTRNLKVRDVAFYDDALLLNKKNRIIPILQQIIAEKPRLRFHTPNGLHAREIDEQVANLFFRSGFRTIRLSFETVNPERLPDMKNKVTPSDLESAVKNLERSGYQRKSLEAYVLMGLPGQSFEEVYRSILFVNSLGLKVSLASFSPIPGTVDFDRAVQQELFPANADPLLTNNSIYPLYRTTDAYWKFHKIRQLVNVLNQGIDRGVNLFTPNELRTALQQMTHNI